MLLQYGSMGQITHTQKIGHSPKIRRSASHWPAAHSKSGTKIGYPADWLEYFGHQRGDGSGDVFFHLDPLWADPEIDFVGVDNYMPLSDWRDGFEHADAVEDWPAIYDRA